MRERYASMRASKPGSQARTLRVTVDSFQLEQSMRTPSCMRFHPSIAGRQSRIHKTLLSLRATATAMQVAEVAAFRHFAIYSNRLRSRSERMHRYARASGRASYQDEILPRVSRTFALTITQLPRALRRVVTNFYLLCRIADTIEDESSLGVAQKQYFHESFVDVVAGRGDADRFALELAPLLVKDALESEQDLVRHSGAVLEITRSFNAVQRAALERCVRIMCEGMPRYERAASTAGLRDQRALDQYCYYVAGVVGETLTELFCDYSPAIAVQGQHMRTLGISFGQGLQMVNILKDFWEDHDRGVCWLPQNLFQRVGVELHRVDSGQYQPGFGAAYARLISIAHGQIGRAHV